MNFRIDFWDEKYDYLDVTPTLSDRKIFFRDVPVAEKYSLYVVSSDIEKIFQREKADFNVDTKFNDIRSFTLFIHYSYKTCRITFTKTVSQITRERDLQIEYDYIDNHTDKTLVFINNRKINVTEYFKGYKAGDIISALSFLEQSTKNPVSDWFSRTGKVNIVEINCVNNFEEILGYEVVSKLHTLFNRGSFIVVLNNFDENFCEEIALNKLCSNVVSIVDEGVEFQTNDIVDVIKTSDFEYEINLLCKVKEKIEQNFQITLEEKLIEIDCDSGGKLPCGNLHKNKSFRIDFLDKPYIYDEFVFYNGKDTILFSHLSRSVKEMMFLDKEYIEYNAKKIEQNKFHFSINIGDIIAFWVVLESGDRVLFTKTIGSVVNVDEYQFNYNFIQNGSENLIICFNSANTTDITLMEDFNNISSRVRYIKNNVKTSNFAKLSELGFDILNIVDLENSYAQYYSNKDEYWKKIVNYIESKFKHYEKIICIGSSKGGYGALKFAEYYNRVNEVHAIVPLMYLPKYPPFVKQSEMCVFNENVELHREKIKSHIHIYTGKNDHFYLDQEKYVNDTGQIHLFKGSHQSEILLDNYDTIFREISIIAKEQGMHLDSVQISNILSDTSRLEKRSDRNSRAIRFYLESYRSSFLSNRYKLRQKAPKVFDLETVEVKDLEECEEKLDTTMMIFLYSFANLDYIVTDEIIDFVSLNRYFRNFFQYFNSSQNNMRYYEQSVSLRAYFLKVVIDLHIDELDEDVVELILRELKILYTDLIDDDKHKHILSNNHGTMRILGLLALEELLGTNFVFSSKRLDMNVSFMFSEYGRIHVENSIGYAIQFSNMVLKMYEIFDIRASKMHEVVKNAFEIADNLVLGFQYGDSGYIPKTVPLLKSHKDIKTNIFAKKEGAFDYLCICGSYSHVHKHFDDTSICVNLDGEKVIVDPGMGGYMYGDYKQFEFLLPSYHNVTYIKENSPMVYSNLVNKPRFVHVEENENYTYIVCHNDKYYNGAITRHIISTRDYVFVCDECVSDIPATFVSNFMIENGKMVSVFDDMIQLNNTNIYISDFVYEEEALNVNRIGVSFDRCSREIYGRSAVFIYVISNFKPVIENTSDKFKVNNLEVDKFFYENRIKKEFFLEKNQAIYMYGSDGRNRPIWYNNPQKLIFSSETKKIKLFTIIDRDKKIEDFILKNKNYHSVESQIANIKFNYRINNLKDGLNIKINCNVDGNYSLIMNVFNMSFEKLVCNSFDFQVLNNYAVIKLSDKQMPTDCACFMQVVKDGFLIASAYTHLQMFEDDNV